MVGEVSGKSSFMYIVVGGRRGKSSSVYTAVHMYVQQHVVLRADVQRHLLLIPRNGIG